MSSTDFDPRDFGAVADGTTIDTPAIQAAIDAAAPVHGRVILSGGTFLTGALFLKDRVEFHLGEHATLLAALEDEHYPTVFSRLAGIEMDGPAAIINAFGLTGVRITGAGLIDGRGQHWWDKYWGPDGKGGLRAEYEPLGLRWASDYDVRRPRVILVTDCDDVLIEGIEIVRSPFWTVHAVYSSNVHIDGVRIHSSFGPSTDGIDIDSCTDVLVENCSIDCADDNIVIKSGRDADGLRVNRPCERVEVRNCRIGEGLGVSLGSDLSGGISDIRFHHLDFDGTDYGFRIKSSRARSGYIRDIEFTDSTMIDVGSPFGWALNWYPNFNAITIPDPYDGVVPAWWHVLAQPTPEGAGPTAIDGMLIRNVTSANRPGYAGPSRAFDIDGYPDQPAQHVRFENVTISAREFGRIVGVEGLILNGVTLSVEQDLDPENDLYDHRTHHQWRVRPSESASA